jgi:hypothetical protein
MREQHPDAAQQAEQDLCDFCARQAKSWRDKVEPQRLNEIVTGLVNANPARFKPLETATIARLTRRWLEKNSSASAGLGD